MAPTIPANIRWECSQKTPGTPTQRLNGRSYML